MVDYDASAVQNNDENKGDLIYRAYDEILARQSRMRRQCRRLLELIDAGNVEETKAKIDSRIQALAEFSAEPAKATQSFRFFFLSMLQKFSFFWTFYLQRFR